MWTPRSIELDEPVFLSLHHGCVLVHDLVIEFFRVQDNWRVSTYTGFTFDLYFLASEIFQGFDSTISLVPLIVQLFSPVIIFRRGEH
jgi:hypothetical protein